MTRRALFVTGEGLESGLTPNSSLFLSPCCFSPSCSPSHLPFPLSIFVSVSLLPSLSPHLSLCTTTFLNKSNTPSYSTSFNNTLPVLFYGTHYARLWKVNESKFDSQSRGVSSQLRAVVGKALCPRPPSPLLLSLSSFLSPPLFTDWQRIWGSRGRDFVPLPSPCTVESG